VREDRASRRGARSGLDWRPPSAAVTRRLRSSRFSFISPLGEARLELAFANALGFRPRWFCGSRPPRAARWRLEASQRDRGLAP
jgi:hypothetical protein